MICSHCKKRILLSHRPGVFLAIAGITACVAGAAWTFLAMPYGIAVGALSAMRRMEPTYPNRAQQTAGSPNNC
jgi:hypothetical protein